MLKTLQRRPGKLNGLTMTTPACRLALMLPDPADQPLSAELITTALGSGDIAALVVPPETPGFSDGDFSLLDAAQARGIACLLGASQAQDLPATFDGLFFNMDARPKTLLAARKAHGREVMLGAVSAQNRDDAMQKGEAGIDVLAFEYDGAADALAPLCELVAWWTELFVLPSLIFGEIDEAAAMALMRAGADFVAPASIWSAASPAAALAPYHQLLGAGDTA